MNQPKLFVCECGYQGIRWNDNTFCRVCERQGKLIEKLEDKKDESKTK